MSPPNPRVYILHPSCVPLVISSRLFEERQKMTHVQVAALLEVFHNQPFTDAFPIRFPLISSSDHRLIRRWLEIASDWCSRLVSVLF